MNTCGIAYWLPGTPGKNTQRVNSQYSILICECVTRPFSTLHSWTLVVYFLPGYTGPPGKNNTHTQHTHTHVYIPPPPHSASCIGGFCAWCPYAGRYMNDSYTNSPWQVHAWKGTLYGQEQTCVWSSTRTILTKWMITTCLMKYGYKKFKNMHYFFHFSHLKYVPTSLGWPGLQGISGEISLYCTQLHIHSILPACLQK